MNIEPENYSAVLFDFDGVLGNTLEDNFRAWSFAFQELDMTLDREAYFLLEGRRSRDMVPMLVDPENFREDLVEEILRLKDAHYAEHNSFTYFPGAPEMLRTMREFRIKHAVVSGGSKKRLTSPPTSQLLGQVSVLITAQDVQKTKPAPDPYLEAAAKLEVAPSKCLVIENAPLGIEAAKNAGMTCIALKSTLAEKHLQMADLILDDLTCLNGFLEPLYLLHQRKAS